MNIYTIYAILIIALIFIIGTIIGSFLNVVILRAFTGESIVLPPSKCPHCKNKLKWWHNIPIVSYIILGGKCYFCHEKISIQYPIIEFITGIIFVLTFFRYGIQIDTPFALATACLLIVLAVTDIKERVVFDKHTYSLIALGLFYNFLITAISVWGQVNTISGFHPNSEWFLYNPMTLSILGLILGALLMEGAARIGYLIAGERAFGEGDTYIAAGLGAVFGWQNLILIFIISIILQLVFTLPIFIRNQLRLKNYTNITALVAFLIYAGVFFFLENTTTIFNNNILMILGLLILLCLGLTACMSILKGIKNQESLTVLPFGPALAIAGIIILFASFTLQF